MALVREQNPGPPGAGRGRLDSGDVTERRDAIRALPDSPEANTALVRRLEVEPAVGVRELIADTLVSRRSAEVVAALMPYLGSEDAGLRTLVARTLAAMPDLVASEVPKLLEDKDPDVRIMTIMLLSDLQHPSIPGWLHAIAEHDPHPNVVGCALNELLPLAGAGDLIVFERAAGRFSGDPFIAFVLSLAESSIA